jgi:glyoxylase-like metal-dependent hydrolase (beta-lactamase superfamily II)
MGPDCKCHVPAIAYLVTDERHHVLVDTGMPKTAETLKHRPNSVQPAGFDIVNRLKQKGLFPDQLHAIILSHLHWDHCAYVACFPGVRKLIQGSEVAFAANPPLDCRLSYKGAKAALEDPNLEIINGEMTYDSKITLIPTPGHSPGHQSIKVQTSVGPFILTGDAVWSAGNQGLSLPRKATSPVAAKNSLNTLVESHIPLLGSHDPFLLKSVVYG